MAFHVGQRVVCVDDGFSGLAPPWPVPPHLKNLHGLKKGRVYTVRAVRDYRGVLCVYLVELWRPVVSSWGECGFAPHRFRPLSESRIDCFRAHLTNMPTKVEA